jgi:hypothetical protein
VLGNERESNSWTECNALKKLEGCHILVDGEKCVHCPIVSIISLLSIDFVQVLSKNRPLFHNKLYFYRGDISIEVVSENHLHFVFMRMATIPLDISLRIEIRTARVVGMLIVQVFAMNAASFSLSFVRANRLMFWVVSFVSALRCSS